MLAATETITILIATAAILTVFTVYIILRQVLFNVQIVILKVIISLIATAVLPIIVTPQELHTLIIVIAEPVGNRNQENL